jgi:hypothetical protein
MSDFLSLWAVPTIITAQTKTNGENIMKITIAITALLVAASSASAQFYDQQSGPYGQRLAPSYRQQSGPYAPQDPRSGGANSGQTIMQDGQGGSCVVPPGASSCFPVR